MKWHINKMRRIIYVYIYIYTYMSYKSKNKWSHKNILIWMMRHFTSLSDIAHSVSHAHTTSTHMHTHTHTRTNTHTHTHTNTHIHTHTHTYTHTHTRTRTHTHIHAHTHTHTHIHTHTHTHTHTHIHTHIHTPGRLVSSASFSFDVWESRSLWVTVTSRSLWGIQSHFAYTHHIKMSLKIVSSKTFIEKCMIA